MKPTAATVLPAPVACSNQKRRSAPGSSGGLGDDLLVLVGRLLPPSPAAPRRGRAPRPRRSSSLAVGSVAPSSALGLGRRPASRPPRRSSPFAVPFVGRDLLLGHQLGQGAGERVDLVRVELGAVAQLRRLVGEQALEPEQQREVAPPLDRGVLGALVELRQRGVEGAAPGGARAPAPRAPRRRAGTARGRTPPPARYRRLKELPLARQLRWSWP